MAHSTRWCVHGAGFEIFLGAPVAVVECALTRNAIFGDALLQARGPGLCCIGCCRRGHLSDAASRQAGWCAASRWAVVSAAPSAGAGWVSGRFHSKYR
eukprot:3186051-Prymnesium_polylepis.1